MQSLLTQRWLFAVAFVVSLVSAALPANAAEPAAPPDGGPVRTASVVHLPLVVRPLIEVDAVATVLAPAGEFLMGCTSAGDPACRPDEQLQRTVRLDAFRIDAVEVTNARYEKCVAAGVCTEPHDTASYTRPAYYGDPAYADYPVIAVDWTQAAAYCAWAGKRLPTEAEWEKAARGADGSIHPWGSAPASCERANFGAADGAGCIGDTAPVGSLSAGASPYGALDMAGNVQEWVSDWYQDDYYLSAPDDNPPGPAMGTHRVLRGGSWYDLPEAIRATARQAGSPTGWDYWYGFRCARTAQTSGQ
jgi:formylglycine-generating enzyme required for sulfatase activity